MAKLSLVELKDYVANVVTAAKLSTDTFNVVRSNVIELVDKIGKIVTIDSVNVIDKLADYDGEYLEFGKTIEEWQADLIMVQDYDASGSSALSPHDQTFRPNFYSETLGKKVIKQTLRNNNLERAVHNTSELVSITSMLVKRMADSMAAYRYQVKREILGKFIALANGEMDYSSATAVGSVTTTTPVGTIMKNSTTNIGILVKKYVSGTKDWATLTGNGTIIELHLVTEIAKPVDTSTGEAFIKQVKSDIETASDLSEGFSLNGNCLGAVEGLDLIVLHGVIPSLEVDTYAGAFQSKDLAVKADIKTLKDFGKDTSGAYAVLIDKRAFRLFNTYRATRENMNGDGDFLNLFDHTEDTGFISRNCFIKVYKIPSEA